MSTTGRVIWKERVVKELYTYVLVIAVICVSHNMGVVCGTPSCQALLRYCSFQKAGKSSVLQGSCCRLFGMMSVSMCCSL